MEKFGYQCCQGQLAWFPMVTISAAGIAYHESPPNFEQRQNMKRLNASGRTYLYYLKGRPLSDDFRASIIDEILRNEGDINTGCFTGRLEDVAKRFKVSRCYVGNLWGRLSRERTIEPRCYGIDLTLQLIETCKRTELKTLFILEGLELIRLMKSKTVFIFKRKPRLRKC